MSIFQSAATRTRNALERPRVGFLGVGWIGRHRMEAIARAGRVEIAAMADPCAGVLEAAAEVAPRATHLRDAGELLAIDDLDAVVIATPSALHAAQVTAALGAGKAVFCQKPLGRTLDENRMVVEAARRADRLLGVDLSYRHTRAMERLRALIAEGAIGRVFAADLVFHNAYGPDKGWYRDKALAGGGCVIDLGIHLVDLVLWTLGGPAVEDASGRLYAGGQPLAPDSGTVEDYATARLDLAGGITARLTCSWWLHAGCDAVIEATFHGTHGALAFRNVGGSFFDFTLERCSGTQRELLVEPPDDWGGRAAAAWAAALAVSPSYRPEVESILPVAAALDSLYGREVRDGR